MKPATIYRRAAQRLYTHGWQQGASGPAVGPNCARNAVWIVGGLLGGLRLADELADQVLGGYGRLTAVNDAPDTTRDDMAMLLLLAAEVVR